MKLYFFSLFFVALALNGFAQIDSGSKWHAEGNYSWNDNNFRLQDQKVMMASDMGYLLSTLKQDSTFNKLFNRFYLDSNSKFSFLESLYFYNCELIYSSEYSFNKKELYKPLQIGTLGFSKCIANDGISISNLAGYDKQDYTEINLGQNQIKHILIRNSSISLQISDFRSIDIYKSKIERINCSDMKISDSLDFGIYDSRLNNFSCELTAKQRARLDFINDTISEYFHVFQPVYFAKKLKDNPPKIEISFIDCHINSSFTFDIISRGAKVVFHNCTFGPKARLASLGVDSVEFNYCLNFERPVLMANLTPIVCHFSFKDSDVEKLKFDYLNAFELNVSNEKSIGKDQVNQAFETLLSKFDKEGKKSSYKRVDIQYRQYKYRSNFQFGYILNFLDKTWWNYGYAPFRVVLWALTFLFFFFLSNAAGWRHINGVYSIVLFRSDNWYLKATNKKLYMTKWLVHVFIFTALIFFSPYVDFGKLSFNRTRWLVWFFLQYLVGLFCLFFIVNAILKF